jgi:hypothetical protein
MCPQTPLKVLLSDASCFTLRSASHRKIMECMHATGDEFLQTVDADTDMKMAEGAPMTARAMEKSLSALGQPAKSQMDLLEAWDALTSPYSESLFSDKRTVAFIDNRDTGTQCWISRDVSERKVCIVTDQIHVEWSRFI